MAVDAYDGAGNKLGEGADRCVDEQLFVIANAATAAASGTAAASSIPPAGGNGKPLGLVNGRFLLAPGGSGRLRRGTGLLQLRGGLCRRLSSGDTVGVTGTLGSQLFAGSYDSKPGRRHQDNHLPAARPAT